MRKKTKQKLTYEIAEKLLESFDSCLANAQKYIVKRGVHRNGEYVVKRIQRNKTRLPPSIVILNKEERLKQIGNLFCGSGFGETINSVRCWGGG